jgi:hypothetical protein
MILVHGLPLKRKASIVWLQLEVQLLLRSAIVFIKLVLAKKAAQRLAGEILISGIACTPCESQWCAPLFRVAAL